MDKRFQHKATERISIESSSKSLRALRALCGKKRRFLIAQVEFNLTTQCTKITKGGAERGLARSGNNRSALFTAIHAQLAERFYNKFLAAQLHDVIQCEFSAATCFHGPVHFDFAILDVEFGLPARIRQTLGLQKVVKPQFITRQGIVFDIHRCSLIH